MKKAVAAILVLAAFAVPARAEANFPPFSNLLLETDIATEAGMAAWQEQVASANENGLVYIDWHLQNFSKSEFFKALVPADGGDDEACTALNGKTGKLDMGEARVNPQDNHQLAQMKIDLDHMPAFGLFECEQIVSAGVFALRIRGFFYAADHRVGTASKTGFYPLEVDPSRLPAGFFKR
jgi:hypothetical protein